MQGHLLFELYDNYSDYMFHCPRGKSYLVIILMDLISCNDRLYSRYTINFSFMLDSRIKAQIPDNVWYKSCDNIPEKISHNAYDIISGIGCEIEIKHISAVVIENRIFHEFPEDVSVLL